jgi:hypothetical protein
LHPGRQPVHHDRLAGTRHLYQHLAQVIGGGDEAAVGLAEAKGAQRAQQQVEAVADLGLGDPDHVASAPVRQPVEEYRGDGVQPDLQGQRRGTAQPGWAGWQQVGEAAGQPDQHFDRHRRTRAVRQGVRTSSEGVNPRLKAV